MEKSRKGPRIYKALLDKDLVAAQQRELALRFDLANESWLAETLVHRFNVAMDAHEAEQGIHRVKPGEWLVHYRGQDITVPLLTSAWAKQLADERSFIRHKTRVEHAILDALRQVAPSSTVDDVWKLATPRSLLPRWEAGGCKRTRMPDTARLIDPRQLAVKQLPRPQPGEVPVPAAVRKPLLAFLAGEAGIGPAQANAMLDFLAAQRESYCPPRDALKPGQAVWLALSVKKHKPPGLQFARRIVLPVILTLSTEAERTRPIPNLKALNEVQMEQVARVCVEAYLQGALLPQVDLELLFLRSYSALQMLLQNYMQLNQVILPTPGTVLDAGTAMTHKRIIIGLSVQGHFTREIARLTYHTPEAVDAYLRVFQSVLVLHLYNLPVDLMARVTGHGRSLIEEHLAIVREHFPDREAVKGYLREQGLEIL